VRIQTFGSELAVQALNKGVVGWFPGPAEVERDAAHKGPQIELSADVFRTIVEPDRLRAPDLLDRPLERFDDIRYRDTSAARRSPATVG
jgi:hypothetical protein